MNDLKEIFYIGVAAAFAIAIMKLGTGVIAAWNVPFVSWFAQAFSEALAVV